MSHVALFILITLVTSLVCTLLKTGEPFALLIGTVRFSGVMFAGIFLLGLIIQIAQSFGGVAGIICLCLIIAASLAAHYLKPHRSENAS